MQQLLTPNTEAVTTVTTTEPNSRKYSEKELTELTSELSSVDKAKKAEAEKKLSTLSSEELMWIVNYERAKSRNGSYVLGGALTALLLATLLLVIFAKKNADDMTMFLCILPALMGGVALSQARKTAIKALAATDSKVAVGNLIESLEIDDKEVKQAVHEALARLLPQLAASDATRLTKEQRRQLRGRFGAIYLPGKKETTYINACVATVKAWEQIGEKEELDLVNEFLKRKWTGSELPVYEAALQCQPYLKVRVEQLEESRTLLRGSSAALDSPDVLLRPAMSGEQTPADELLRPAIASDQITEEIQPLKVNP